MASFVSCSQCSRPHARDEVYCPFCASENLRTRRPGAFLAAVAMGLSLAGCVDDGEGSTTEATTIPDGVDSDSAGEATYGVPMTETGDTDPFGESSTTTGAGLDTDTDATGSSSSGGSGTGTGSGTGSSSGGGTSSSTSG